MSKRNSIINSEPRTPLRRSPRFLHREKNPSVPQEPSTVKSKIIKNSSISSDTPINSAKWGPLRRTRSSSYAAKISKDLCRSSGGLRRSPRLNCGTEAFQSLRRSPRFLCDSGDEKVVKNSGEGKSRRTGEDEFKAGVGCGWNKSKGKSEVRKDSREEIAVRIERSTRKSVICSTSSREKTEGTQLRIVVGLRANTADQRERIKKDVGKGSEDVGGHGKRKRTEGKESSEIQGWTKEQEVALQRAYLAAKPTPHFWKKVAKLVPGKSAQECFDKINSDLATPPQPQPRTRAKKITSSPIAHFSFSASKLLKPVDIKLKKLSRNRQKSHLVQKKVRQLAQKNYLVDKDHESDFFSDLEPNSGSSTQARQQNSLVSTPENLPRKQEFLKKCWQSSSGRKKPLSRLSSLSGTALVSPPVLKQVKNKALHEKYIDLLHFREAKRKAESAREEKTAAGKENKEINGHKTEVVKAAKSALISDARNAIDQLKYIHAEAMYKYDDLDCDDFERGDNDDDDNESEL